MTRRINQFFRLTNKIPLTLIRSQGKGDYDEITGKWVPSTKSPPLLIEANVQPLRYSQTLLLPVAERTKEWINIISQQEIRKMKEGVSGWDADSVLYNGNVYKVMEVRQYKMGVLDHYHAHAALDSPTPRSSP